MFRALRSARRLTQPPLRHLLKKVDENFSHCVRANIDDGQKLSHRVRCEHQRSIGFSKAFWFSAPLTVYAANTIPTAKR